MFVAARFALPAFRAVADAGHYDFPPPCDARLARARHEQLNADLVRSFRPTLP